MGHIKEMDIQPDIFETLRATTILGQAKGSSDFDLSPTLLSQLAPNRVLRPASVLIPLIKRNTGVQVILTRRSGNLLHHPGQVAFPGGKVDSTDASAKDAALREAEEEIGLPRQNVEILGAIGQHETISRFSVIPYLGRVIKDFTPTPESGEVAEVFEVPLEFLLKPENYQTQSRVWLGQKGSYLTIPYGPHFIWGATARILKGLADRVALL